MNRALACALAILAVFMIAGVDAGCPRGCALCKGIRCLRCKPGYWLKAGKCYACPSRCATCKNSGGAAYCQTCKPGYLLQSGKCTIPACPTPHWDTNEWKWADVYGKTDAGACVKCTPTGYHKEWCKACDGDAPSICTKCEDPNNHFPMFIDATGACQFCTAWHEGCLSCQNGTGKCLSCDASQGYQSDGAGNCVRA